MTIAIVIILVFGLLFTLLARVDLPDEDHTRGAG
jgi:hypothetical protein